LRLIERGEMMAEMMHEDEQENRAKGPAHQSRKDWDHELDKQEAEPKNRHASHARTGTMSLTNRQPSGKAISTEKAPGAGIGESWGGCKDGCITFVKNAGEGGGAWYEIAASVCCKSQQNQAGKRA
jgi:hypothetical protein